LMGIRFNCPNGHKLNVKEFLAGKRGVCPQCGAKFIIPAQAEVPQPVGVGQSQSVEIAISPGPSHQAAGAAASPSVIIPVTDIELAPPELELPTAIHEPQNPAADVLPASIVAVQSPVAVSPVAAIPSPRERSRRNQVVISLLLLGLVVLLAGVLIWVLQRDANQTPAEKKAAEVHGESNQVVAIASSGLFVTAHSRVGALKL
jgi:hypothetical protein